MQPKEVWYETLFLPIIYNLTARKSIFLLNNPSACFLCKKQKGPKEALLQLLFRLVVVAVGVLALPPPGVDAHPLDVVLRLPPQLGLGLGGVGPALGDVAGPGRGDLVGDLLACLLYTSRCV